MSDDSLTEADNSFFDLYSTRTVTNTYNEVLKTLISASSKNGNVTCEQNGRIKEASEEKAEDDLKSPERDDSPEIMILEDLRYPLPNADEAASEWRSVRLRRRAKERNKLLDSTLDTSKNGSKRSNKRKKKNQDIEIIEDVNQELIDINTSVDDEINYEVSVKVIWKSVSIKTFRLRRFQKFTKIFEHFMREENVPLEKILLSSKSIKIGPNDTPELLNLKGNDFIEGGVLSNSIVVTNKAPTQVKCSNEKDCIVIKVQDVAKKVLQFSLSRKESLKSVMIRYAEQIEVPLEKIKFYFDGDILNSSETPESLGLDNDEIIDVKIM